MARKTTFITKNGYRKYKGSKRYVHRCVAERKLGRKLRQQEVVHHIDGNPLNNTPSNLWVYKNQSAHMKAHNRNK
jgi:hypothetical protein